MPVGLKHQKPKHQRAKQQTAPIAPDVPSNKQPQRRSNLPRYLLLLMAFGGIEIALFGSNGHVKVCVAREQADFALLDLTRTPENTRRYPTCERRLNIGLTSELERATGDAHILACRRATILQDRRATLNCATEQQWHKHLTLSWCPPWHEHSYKRLLWFLQ